MLKHRSNIILILAFTAGLISVIGCKSAGDLYSNKNNVILELVIDDESNSATTTALNITDSTYTWKHWDYELNENNTIEPFNSRDERFVVTETYDTKVIENNYLRVTLLPEFGGRILSIFYKPTGHELLYQNPIGTPYGNGNPTFYYRWLMVIGGIYPTFPYPEHGKAWLLPWDTEIVVQTEDQISVKMSFTDTIGLRARATNMTCEATVSIYKNSPVVDLGIKLINNRDQAINYEYWTCTTLAPGSIPGDTKCPPNSKFVVPIENFAAGWSPGDWTSRITSFSKIDELSEWPDMGIGYGVGLKEDWWGVINGENQEGILRIGDNKNHTPGLKFWTWGNPESSRYDSRDPSVYVDVDSRPFMEPWAGVSKRFFSEATLEEKEVKSWIESYIPTVGLEDVTYANRNGSVDLSYKVNGNNIDFTATVFTTLPGKEVSLTAKDDTMGFDTNISSFSTLGNSAAEINFTVPLANEPGVYTFIIKNKNNETLMEKKILLEL